jgi:Tol biopolymer transport system component
LLRLVAVPAWTFVRAQTAATRPMTFLDTQQMRQVAAETPSPDGKWMLYTLSTPDWKEAKPADRHLTGVAPAGRGVDQQMTFTKEKNETSPRWARDGSFFLFLSNREAPESAASRNQLYMMRPDGGEARRISDAKEGVADFALSEDGRWVAFRSGKTGEEQLYSLPGNIPDGAVAEQITKHPTGVRSWRWAPDGKRIYFVTPDTIDEDEKARRDKKFTVNIRNPETPVSSLWALDVAARNTKRLTDGGAYSADDFTISKDSKWIGFQGLSANRYKRGITQENLYASCICSKPPPVRLSASPTTPRSAKAA